MPGLMHLLAWGRTPAAAGATAAAATSGAPGGSGGDGGAGKPKKCAVCGDTVSTFWLVVKPCKHVGPCLKCGPEIAGAGAMPAPLLRPREYPTCKVCQQPVETLVRVIM
jgi:hypothetical protein